MLALENYDLFGEDAPSAEIIKIADLKPNVKEKSYILKIRERYNHFQSRDDQSGFFEEREAKLYMSGCSGFADMLGYLSANKHICVNTLDINEKGLELLKAHLCIPGGSDVFVDSGAFRLANQESKSGSELTLNFDGVFNVYFDLAFKIPDTSRLTVCAPDILGNQSESISLQLHYQDKLKYLIGAGVKIMFPIQKGELDLEIIYNQLCETFGSEMIIIGLPAATAAIPHDELVEFLVKTKPRAVHILGANKNKKIVKRALYASPNTIFSCDANRTAAYVGQGCALTELHADLLEDSLDFYQELSDNARGEVCREIPTALNHPLTGSLDLHMDYTEFDELEFIKSLSDSELRDLCSKLKGYLDNEHTTAEYLLKIEDEYGSMFSWLEETYTDDFASLVIPMFWDFYLKLVETKINNTQHVRTNISPKCRTESIRHLAENKVFE